jgi:hypothetical protein
MDFEIAKLLMMALYFIRPVLMKNLWCGRMAIYIPVLEHQKKA